jgi:hypothetical protein
MTSLRQIEANRRNAQQSTGPRTPRGKAVVALNALRHGLLAREAVIQGESAADLVDLARRLRHQLAPMGELELLLVDRIVATVWRLHRAIALETRLFDTERGDSSAYDGTLAYKCDRDKLQLISRYELTLERSLYRALHELQRLQATRAGVPVPPLPRPDGRGSGGDRARRARLKWLCSAKAKGSRAFRAGVLPTARWRLKALAGQ